MPETMTREEFEEMRAPAVDLANALQVAAEIVAEIEEQPGGRVRAPGMLGPFASQRLSVTLAPSGDEQAGLRARLRSAPACRLVREVRP